MSTAGPSRRVRSGCAAVFAVLLLTICAVATIASAGYEPIDKVGFERTITAPGVDERLSHNASTGKPVYTETPNGTDRVRVHTEWKDGDADRLRVTVYEGGDCGVDCPFRDPWKASGTPPVALAFEAPENREISVEISASEGPQVQRTVVGEIVFLADDASSDADRPGSEEPTEQGKTSSDPSVAPSWPRVGVGLAALAGIGAALWRVPKRFGSRWRWLAPLWTLFSRQEKEDLLEHPLRDRIVEAVDRRPGIHLEALVRELDAGRGQLDRHLRQLVAADLLVEEIGHGYRAYFRPGDVRPEVRPALLVLKTDGARRIVESLADSPRESVRAIARETELAPSTVSYHMDRLEDHGLVRGPGGDEPDGYDVSELARRALDHRQP